MFIHNSADGQREAQAMVGDAPLAPIPADAPLSYARIWIDALETDPARAIKQTIAEALEWPREHGEKVIHMTATTSLELELGPGFDQQATVVRALQAAFAAADLRMPPGLSKSA